MARPREHPKLGRARDDVRNGYRSIRIGAHVIFYVIRENEVHVVRILPGRADLDGSFDP